MGWLAQLNARMPGGKATGRRRSLAPRAKDWVDALERLQGYRQPRVRPTRSGRSGAAVHPGRGRG